MKYIKSILTVAAAVLLFGCQNQSYESRHDPVRTHSFVYIDGVLTRSVLKDIERITFSNGMHPKTISDLAAEADQIGFADGNCTLMEAEKLKRQYRRNSFRY